MTLVLGLETPEGVWIGSDSLVTTPDSRDVLREGKWFTLGACTLGWSGDLRVAQVARALPPPGRRRPKEGQLDYLVRTLVEPLRVRLAARGIALDGDYLVAVKGSLYHLQSDYSLVHSARGYAAVGSGAPYALGALDALPATQPPRARLLAALAAAATHCPTVGEPFHVVRLTP